MLVKTSVLTGALIVFFLSSHLHGAMPLTSTIYTIPEGEIEIAAAEEIYRINTGLRRETYKLGMGILPRLSIWYSFQYLHRGLIKSDASALGDSFFKVWYYTGNYFNNSLHLGFQINLRIPTGMSAYAGTKWRNLAFGNNELKIGPVLQLDLPAQLYFHLNLFYVFREGEDEGFYEGFSIDLFEKDTYTDIFGLNFESGDAFLAKNRLKNDYAVVSAALNTDIAYPLIIYTEIYLSRRVYEKDKDKIDEISIEGSGVNPVFFSAGLRYFFNESVYAGLYYIVNLNRAENYIKDIIGIDFSLQF